MTGSPQKRKFSWALGGRFLLAFVGLFGCYRLIYDSVNSGLSRLLSTTAIVQSNVRAADFAVSLAPDDPEAHYTRALSLVNLNRVSDAILEFGQATRLRPYHYYEWLDLGVSLDRSGDQAGGASALAESIRLAPFFAQPRWQLGNILYRQGRYGEAFVELRRGAASNPNLFGGLVELAWAATNGDVNEMQELVQPQNGRNHLELASFLAKQGKGAQAITEVREAGDPKDDDERTILREIIAGLLSSKQFDDAYAVWATVHHVASDRTQARIVNGDFAETILQNDPGFNWQLGVVQNVSVAIDPSGPDNVGRSLCVNFSGDSVAASRLITQIILLQPGTKYSLSFKAKAESLVTGGPPVVRVLDELGSESKSLGQSAPLSPGTTGWKDYQFEFSTDERTSAVVIALQRLDCNQPSCPIFGKLWLSNLVVTKR
jgi:Carbohydrate binding domain